MGGVNRGASAAGVPKRPLGASPPHHAHASGQRPCASSSTFEVATRGAGLTEITAELEGFVARAAIDTGLVTAFCRHTSCSLLIQENADPDVQRDLITFFRKLAPEGMDWVVHDAEGPEH